MRKNIAKILLLLLAVISLPENIHALDTSKSNFLGSNYQNNLINDSSFTDINSMSVADIQNFLSQKGSILATVDPSQLGSGANGRSAAQIIYDAAHAAYAEAAGDWYGISINSNTGTVSPKVILVMLQKEESLVTAATAGQDTLDCALGYDFDGSGCQSMFQNHPSLRGFSAQIGNGAWQLRYNFEYAKRGTKPNPPLTTHYIVGEKDNICDDNCYNVEMTNAATGALYSYTPHVFDSAYNFWSFFNNWFTATPEAPPAAVANDTTAYSMQTFAQNITVGGSKDSTVAVFFDNQLIEPAGKTSWQLTFQAEIGTKDYTVNYKDGNSQVVATKPIHIERHAAADINGDSKVDLQDLSVLSSFWDQNKPGNALADLNGDGIVDILDLSLMAANWHE